MNFLNLSLIKYLQGINFIFHECMFGDI